MDGTITDETEVGTALDVLKAELRCPRISDYVYWDFDPELSAEKVVDRAMAYEPFAL
ncbi:e9imm peptide [Streptomyces sp. NPDC048352]|uniref:e9imm peptide n=1 Tax=Streptomyces sp. NPDC048352 TaxID=3154718 RepID=UPI00342DE75D